ncbi:MAG: hypothetical protein RLZZ37_452 [Actinomycetota bacterium]
MLSDKTIAPMGINLISLVGLPPCFRGAPPKNPPEMSSGDTNKPIRSAHVTVSLNLELSRIS